MISLRIAAGAVSFPLLLSLYKISAFLERTNTVTPLSTDQLQLFAELLEKSRQPQLRGGNVISYDEYEVPQYDFPSVDERFEYYMGSWYDNTNWTVESPLVTNCPSSVDIDYLQTVDDRNLAGDGAFHDKIFSLSTLEVCAANNQYYCDDAYDTLQRTTATTTEDDDNPLALFHFGDGYNTKYTSLPVISKSRPALHKDNDQQHVPIIWPLEMTRHFNPIEEVGQMKVVEWDDKLSKIFWRGSTTGNRIDVLSRWINYDPDIIDIAFTNIPMGEMRVFNGYHAKYLQKYNVRDKAQIDEMSSKYKYLLSVEGNDVATGLKWMLYNTNSVVFMSPPTKATWAMEDLLLPFVHYIPLANDYSNLFEMLIWAEQHQTICQQISQRSTEYIERLWLSEQAQIDNDILKERLATAYVNQFHKQLSQCKKIEAVQAANIKSITLIGERHSGTKWITKHLTDCFGDQIEVKDRLSRWKHWFQEDEMSIGSSSSSGIQAPSSALQHNHLVVSLFRDPYDWVDRMRKAPYHIPHHKRLDWKEFVTKPYTPGYRWHGDEELLHSGEYKEVTCLNGFKFHDVIPCFESDKTMNTTANSIVYELKRDGSGQPYDSIVDMRRDKIINFLEVANFDRVASFLPMQYEYLVSNGTSYLIGQIEDVTGLQAKCQAEVSQELQQNDKLDDEYVQWMNEHVDWEVEGLIGYNKR